MQMDVRFSTLNFISAIFPVYLFIFIVFGLVFIADHCQCSCRVVTETDFAAASGSAAVFVVLPISLYLSPYLSPAEKEKKEEYFFLRFALLCPAGVCACVSVSVCYLRQYKRISVVWLSVVMNALCACAYLCVCVPYLPKLSLWFAICSSSVNRLGYVLSIELA